MTEGGEEINTGGNASAEGGGEELDDNVKVVDAIEHTFHLNAFDMSVRPGGSYAFEMLGSAAAVGPRLAPRTIRVTPPPRLVPRTIRVGAAAGPRLVPRTIRVGAAAGPRLVLGPRPSS